MTNTLQTTTKKQINIYDLLENDAIMPDVLAYVWTLLDAKKICLLIGPSGTGKTVLCEALLELINEKWHVMTIEKTPEHSLNRLYHTKILLKQHKEKKVSLAQALGLAMMQKLDYIAVEDSGFDDLKLLFEVAGTGIGCISTLQASVKTLCEKMKGQLLYTSLVVISCDKIEGNKRGIRNVSEMHFSITGNVETNEIFNYRDNPQTVSDRILKSDIYKSACANNPEQNLKSRKLQLTK